MRPVLLLGLAGSMLSGCRCEEERPYTPFHLPSADLGAPSASAAPSGLAPTNQGVPFEPVEAMAFPPPEHRAWKSDDFVVRPPQGHRLDRGFAADLDADGKKEAVVWTVPLDSTGEATPTLWLFAEGQKPVSLTTMPPFIPSGPGCRSEARLFHSGPRTAAVDLQARCDAALIARTPTRALVVVAPREERPVLLTLRVADPALGETLDLGVESTDRDADGRDDVRVTASVHTGDPSRAASVDFVWLDRTAGLARDPGHPRKAFEDIGSLEAVRAKGPKTGRGVGSRVENARRLFASACAESGVSRVFDGDGSALPCGSLRHAFDRYVEAEMAAATTIGRPHEALGAYLRAGWFGGAPDEKTDQRLVALLEASVPSSPAEAKTLAVRASERGSSPRWSPLRFEADGSLLVLTATGMARFDGSGEPLGSADEEVDPWPLMVADSGGVRWAGWAFSCDRNEGLFLMNSSEGAPLPPEPARLLSPRPGGCRGGSFPDVPIPSPLVWTAEHRWAAVAGSVVAPLAQPDTELPEGSWFALGSRLGLVVFGRGVAQRWDVPKPSELADCVVAPRADRIACVRGASGVALITGQAPAPTAGRAPAKP